jgi:hypothetical protein
MSLLFTVAIRSPSAKPDVNSAPLPSRGEDEKETELTASSNVASTRSIRLDAGETTAIISVRGCMAIDEASACKDYVSEAVPQAQQINECTNSAEKRAALFINKKRARQSVNTIVSQ